MYPRHLAIESRRPMRRRRIKGKKVNKKNTLIILMIQEKTIRWLKGIGGVLKSIIRSINLLENFYDIL